MCATSLHKLHVSKQQFDEVTEFMINKLKPTVFLCIIYQLNILKLNFPSKSLFRIESKRTKFLGTNLAR